MNSRLYFKFLLYLLNSDTSTTKKFNFLILPVPCISESCIEIKIKLDFYFPTSLLCLKRPSIKLFEAPQRSVKIKIELNFLSPSGSGTGRVEVI